MNGSSTPPYHLQPPTTPCLLSQSKLRSYDQQRLNWKATVNLIIQKSQSFQQERRCELHSQWLEQYFPKAKAKSQICQLAEYYRFYRNSPTLACSKYLEIMTQYWNKSKSLFYRKIKRELQLDEEPSEPTAEENIPNTIQEGKQSAQAATFELPSHLRSSYTTLLSDPDATLRKLLTALNTKKQYREQTRQASKICQYPESTVKSHTKTHLRTNPSHLVSTSSFKKTKKKLQHKSLSNEPRKISPKPFKEKKMISTASCPKIKSKPSELNLVSLKKTKPEKKATHPKKQANRDNRERRHPKEANHTKTKEASVKKGRQSVQRSQTKQGKRSSIGKAKEAETAKVKAAIERARDKIKAEKSAMLKKYVQSRRSCAKSNESRQADQKRFRK